jgi:hypothetical protein
MAKIDTSLITGYEDMTLEEKVAALEGFEYDDLSSDVERYKNAVSKANSEAAEWKKKYNAQLSEDEQAKQAKDDEMDEIKAELNRLRLDKDIAENRANLIELGYDNVLAEETAQALIEGNLTKVFENQKKFMTTYEKGLKAEILRGTSRPPGGGPPPVMTIEGLRKMTVQERLEFSRSNPEEYEQLYKQDGGNE